MRSLAYLASTVALGIALFLVAGLFSPSPAEVVDATVARSFVASSKAPRAVPGELLVRFKADTPASERAGLRRRVGGELERKLPVRGLEQIQVEEVKGAEARLERDDDVLYAEPNYLRRAEATPNDPHFPSLWGLQNTGQTVDGATGTADADIDAPEAWDLTTGSADVTVAIVDSGVAYDHPDLAPNLWANAGEAGARETNGVDDDGNGFVDDARGWDFVDADNRPLDFDGHGTHVAGTVGARGNDAQGVAGADWNVRLMPLRVLDANGSGSVADVIEAYGYASRSGARVVNASLGGSGRSEAERDAIRAAAGTLFVVAAGNDATNNEATPQYPCNHSTDVDRPATNVVCVAASDHNDSLAWFSNFGSRSVHLAAPGTNVLSAQPVWSAHFNEGFETDIAGRWSTGGVGSSWGRTTTAAHAGAFSLTDSPTGGYQNLADAWAQTSAPIDLTGRAGCRLSNRVRHELEDGADHLLVEASANGATWTALDRHTGSTGGAFRYFDYDLSGFDGRPVYLRYRLESNATVTADGAYVDSVAVSCLSSTYTGGEFAYFDGTSMATPHVAGAAALVFARYPSAAVAEVKGRILNNVDPKGSLATKTTSGGRLNALRALTAEAAAPQPGPAPTQPPPAPPAQRDSTAPRLSVMVASRQRLSKVLARGLASRVGCSEACTVRTYLRLDGRTAKALRLSRGKPVVLGKGSRSFSGAGQAVLSIRLGRRAKAGLRRARRTVRASLATEATDPAGNRSSGTRRIALRR